MFHCCVCSSRSEARMHGTIYQRIVSVLPIFCLSIVVISLMIRLLGGWQEGCLIYEKSWLLDPRTSETRKLRGVCCWILVTGSQHVPIPFTSSPVMREGKWWDQATDLGHCCHSCPQCFEVHLGPMPLIPTCCFFRKKTKEESRRWQIKKNGGMWFVVVLK